MAVLAMLAAAALAVAAPASARLRQFTAPLSATGGVTVSWHGDPARGCASAGLCGYRGSLAARPGSEGQFELAADGARVRQIYGYLTVTPSPVIRVQRADEGACVDLAPSGELEVAVSRAGPGRVRIGLEWYGLDAGRCAGPDVPAALERLPSRTVALASLRRGGLSIALPSHVGYGNGRFAGTVSSNLRLHIGRFARARRAGRIYEPDPRVSRPRRPVRVVDVLARYRVAGLTGKLTTRFGALTAPLCASLDACGVSGATSWSILSAGGTMLVSATARARPGDRGLRGAIAAIERRSAVVSAFGRFRHALGTTSAEVSRTGGAACLDSQRVPAPGLGFVIGRGQVALELGGDDALPAGGDVARAGCPGPPQSDVLGRRGMAGATLPASALRLRRLEVPLRGQGRFRDPAYAGTHRAHFTLGLRRVGLHISYRVARAGG
jgi:hypothetical protein